jgi:hypothetical protein
MVIEPGGKVIYAKEGPVDPAAMKTLLVNDPTIGRYY